MRKLAVTLVVLAACGGGSSVSIDEYPDAVREAFCRYLARCGDVESVDTCQKINIGLTIHVSASLEAAIDMGKTKYSSGDAGACLDAFGNRACDLTSRSNRAIPDACLKINAGTQPGGAACALGAECVSLVCDVPSCDQACCLGTCVGDTAPGRAKLGQSCENSPCDADSFCDDATLTCVALKAAGAGCVFSDECQYGLDCGATGTCAALPGLGEPCNGVCRDEGTTCSPATRTCVKVGLAGAVCASGFDCSPLYRCDASKHCARGLALGEACTVSQLCGDDRAFCDVAPGQATGVCALPKADGATCSRDAACDSLFCDPVALTCAAEPVCI